MSDVQCPKNESPFNICPEHRTRITEGDSRSTLPAAGGEKGDLK